MKSKITGFTLLVQTSVDVIKHNKSA